MRELIERHLFRRSPLSDVLLPFSLIYGQIQARKAKKNRTEIYESPAKVIGIGNIVSGGSGKTPFTIALGRLALEDGMKAGISHRGYKGRLEGRPTLISKGEGLLFDARDCGDEAWLIAKALPQTTIAVGKDRARALKLLAENTPDIILMDDVFQNHRIIKDIEIACFDAQVGLGNGRLLPAGYLREGLPALKRAKLCVINRKEPGLDVQPLIGKLLPFCPWIEVVEYTTQKESPQLRDEAPRTILASGIASPHSFESTAAQVNISWMRHFAFTDHYHFRSREALTPLLKYIKDEGIERIICTAKDYPKLMRHRDLAPLVQVLELIPDSQQIRAIWNRLKGELNAAN